MEEASRETAQQPTASAPIPMPATNEPGGAGTGDVKAEAPTADLHAGIPIIPAELANHPRYEIESIIGRGGMGAVYRARHRMMDRVVALKTIGAAWVDKPGAVERFRREVKTAARLSHPRIVAAFDADQAGDLHFLVMEYVEGKTLAQLVQDEGPLPLHTACQYAHEAALGLQYAYQNGAVHRDVKPHNLILTSKGQLKILDFGLARFVSEAVVEEKVLPGIPAEVSGEEAEGVPTMSPIPGDTPGFSVAKLSFATRLTSTGALVGTADYIAPEQIIAAEASDIRADIYSLGCTLYYLLIGQPPFPGDDLTEKLTAHLEQHVPLLSDVRRGVPPEVSLVVSKMMAKKREDRFQTPADVAEALVTYIRPQHRSLHAEQTKGPSTLLTVAIIIWTVAIVAAGALWVYSILPKR